MSADQPRPSVTTSDDDYFRDWQVAFDALRRLEGRVRHQQDVRLLRLAVAKVAAPSDQEQAR